MKIGNIFFLIIAIFTSCSTRFGFTKDEKKSILISNKIVRELNSYLSLKHHEIWSTRTLIIDEHFLIKYIDIIQGKGIKLFSRDQFLLVLRFSNVRPNHKIIYVDNKNALYLARNLHGIRYIDGDTTLKLNIPEDIEKLEYFYENTNTVINYYKDFFESRNYNKVSTNTIYDFPRDMIQVFVINVKKNLFGKYEFEYFYYHD